MASKLYVEGLPYIELHNEDHVIIEGDSICQKIKERYILHNPEITEQNFKLGTINGMYIIGPFKNNAVPSIINDINGFVSRKK